MKDDKLILDRATLEYVRMLLDREATMALSDSAEMYAAALNSDDPRRAALTRAELAREVGAAEALTEAASTITDLIDGAQGEALSAAGKGFEFDLDAPLLVRSREEATDDDGSGGTGFTSPGGAC